MYDKDNDINYLINGTVDPEQFINNPIIHVDSALSDKIDLTNDVNKNLVDSVIELCTESVSITLLSSEIALNEISKITNNVASLMNLGFVFA